MSGSRWGVAEAIAELYAQVGAPDWAAPNLDGLADVLRDLSWLPDGPVEVLLADATPEPVAAVVTRVAGDSVASRHPVVVVRDTLEPPR